MLLESNGGDADVRNDMLMSPAHLAKSVECLEVLFTFGADMAALDINGRSPLFVACAMNREQCAEYIINCLDQCETSLLIKDNRGDTPLHAAACNGAVDCLLMLLQYGIDPRTANAKGLKAIELALRNKQKKCRDLLAEYHLHYCTSSDFDSVLFLATLEVSIHDLERNYVPITCIVFKILIFCLFCNKYICNVLCFLRLENN
jgi:ankyrin repeat protein